MKSRNWLKGPKHDSIAKKIFFWSNLCKKCFTSAFRMIDQNLNVRNQDMIERDTEPRNHCYVNRARTIFLYK